MPEINPLSNEQIFLKKIAENTGSDYETGDVSEINPLTIDQIFLKEIAANTAGQSGDITELEEKVTANTSAIEAINVNGACNALPIDLAVSDTIDGVTFTVTTDGIVVSGTATANIDYPLHSNSPVLNKNVNYKLTGCPAGGTSDTYYLQVGLWNSSTFIDGYRDYGNGNSFNSENNTGISGNIIIKSGTAITTPITFKPMLYDTRLNPTGYVSYSMTNRELTERVRVVNVNMAGHSVNDYVSVDLPDGFTISNTVILTHNLLGYSQIYSESTSQLESELIVRVFISVNDGKLYVKLAGANTPNCSIDVVLMKK